MNGSYVIPSEQRETRNPGGKIGGKYPLSLDARLRGHDGHCPINIDAVKY
jgi:hypothetical protein